MAKRKGRYRYEWIISDDCRRTKDAKTSFLHWMKANYADAKQPPTPAEVVDSARSKNSQIHDLFQWDVKKAARQAWLAEAGYLLRHLHTIKVETTTNVVVGPPVRAFIPMVVGQYGRVEPGHYQRAQRVANNPSMRKTVLEKAHLDFLAWLERYRRYHEFMEVFSPVLEAYAKVQNKHDNEAS